MSQINAQPLFNQVQPSLTPGSLSQSPLQGPVPSPAPPSETKTSYGKSFPPSPLLDPALTSSQPLGPVSTLELELSPLNMEQAFDGLTPKQAVGISAESLLTAKQALLPVSQNAVLRLGELDTTVLRSSQSLTAKTPSSPFDRDRLPGPAGTLTVVAHGDGETIGGKSPQALAEFLKSQGIVQLGKLELTSCGSQGLVNKLKAALADAQIQVGEVVGHEKEIVIDDESGQVFSLGEPSGLNHSGTLGGGLFSSCLDDLDELDFPENPLQQLKDTNDNHLKTFTGSTGADSSRILTKSVYTFLDQRIENAPKEIQQLFKSAKDELTLVQTLATCDWTKQTLMDAMYIYEVEFEKLRRDAIQYKQDPGLVKPNQEFAEKLKENFTTQSFGHGGFCNQTSCCHKKLLDGLFAKYGTQEQTKTSYQIKIIQQPDGNKPDHYWLKYTDLDKDHSLVIDATWRQFRMKDGEDAQYFSELSKDVQNRISKDPMIFIGSEKEHDLLTNYMA